MCSVMLQCGDEKAYEIVSWYCMWEGQCQLGMLWNLSGVQLLCQLTLLDWSLSALSLSLSLSYYTTVPAYKGGFTGIVLVLVDCSLCSLLNAFILAHGLSVCGEIMGHHVISLHREFHKAQAE